MSLTAESRRIPMTSPTVSVQIEIPRNTDEDKAVIHYLTNKGLGKPIATIKLDIKDVLSIDMGYRRIYGWSLEAKLKEGLDGRRISILRRMAEGQTNREIATGEAISPTTVKREINVIFNVLGVNNQPHAVASAFRLNLIN